MPKEKKKRSRKRSSSSSTSTTSSSSTSSDSVRNRKRGTVRKNSVSKHMFYKSNTNMNSSIIPEFDPQTVNIDEWIEVIDYTGKIYGWSDEIKAYEALSKLKGTAKTWYDNFIQYEKGWSRFNWNKWKKCLMSTFQSTRNTYELFMDIANHRPQAGCSLYEFHFLHLAKINKLKANFSNADKVSLIIGAINDNSITSAVEAANMKDPNVLAAYLRNKICKNENVVVTTNKNEMKENLSVAANSYGKKNIICRACGKSGHDKRICRHRDKSCNFCLKKGHIEKHCFTKQNEYTNEKKKLSSRPVKKIKESGNMNEATNNASKFYKTIEVNGTKCKAFIDFGSDCSLVSRSWAHKLKVQIKNLDKHITLSGFLGVGINVKYYADALTEIDSVKLKIKYYIVDDERLCSNILIGRNFTENEDIVYFRLDNELKFLYKKDKPIAFFSKQTTDQEKNYHSFELELLAIVKTLERYKYYLIGNEFTVITDCISVRNALDKQKIIPRIARWVLALQDFSFKVEHRAGTQMKHVDALSRNFEERANEILVIQEKDYLREAQDQDSKIKDIKNTLLSGDIQNHRDIFNDYDLRGNIVYKTTVYGRKVYVPKNCRWQIVKANHDDIGHFAFDKTFERVKERYWFPRMRRFVKKYVESCLQCLYHKEPGGKKPGYLHSMPKYARPHHTMHIDHLGPFIESENKNKYLLVIVDGFTKFVHLKAVPDTSAKQAIDKLNEIFAVLGNPRRIISDAGTAFTSQSFKKFVEDKGIKLFITAVGLPRGNGQVERVNKTVLDALATTGAQIPPDKWDMNITTVQQGINSTKHRITQYTPSELLFGFKLRTDGDLYVSDGEELINVTKIRKQTSEKLEQNRIKQDIEFNKKRRAPKIFNVGDLVLTKVTSIPASGESKKLLPKFRGPFKVVEVLPNDRVRVKEDVHTSRCSRPYEAVIGMENLKHFKFQER